VETEVDKQGRVLLPPMLRKRARLDGDAVLMGQYTRFDVWAEDLWNERFGDGPGKAPASLDGAFLMLKR
ncbi:MAG: MraZ C-terminal domain-containing protein, partial [Stenotrophobium sp.]